MINVEFIFSVVSCYILSYVRNKKKGRSQKLGGGSFVRQCRQFGVEDFRENSPKRYMCEDHPFETVRNHSCSDTILQFLCRRFRVNAHVS